MFSYNDVKNYIKLLDDNWVLIVGEDEIDTSEYYPVMVSQLANTHAQSRFSTVKWDVCIVEQGSGTAAEARSFLLGDVDFEFVDVLDREIAEDLAEDEEND